MDAFLFRARVGVGRTFLFRQSYRAVFKGGLTGSNPLRNVGNF